MKIEGKDNEGNPRQIYSDRIMAMNDEDFRKALEDAIWFSSYAANNPRSDYHWKCNAAYSACIERYGNDSVYDKAWHRVSGM